MNLISVLVRRVRHRFTSAPCITRDAHNARQQIFMSDVREDASAQRFSLRCSFFRRQTIYIYINIRATSAALSPADSDAAQMKTAH